MSLASGDYIDAEAVEEGILAIEAEAAALAHDQPSGSGLHECGEDCLFTCPDCDHEVDHGWTFHAPTCRFVACIRVATAPHVRALSGSSDPEAGGLDVERLARAIAAVGRSYMDQKVREWEPDWMAGAIAAEYARLTEAKPESPA